MKIRKAKMGDLKEILKLFNSSKNLIGQDDGYYSDYHIKQYIQGPVFKTFVVEIDKEIVGVALIQVWKKAKYSYLENVVIKKEFMGRGIGKTLMIFLENYVKKGGSNFYFYYSEENNKVMHKLSSKLNYKKGKKFVFYSKELK